jgi:hypothetical protein
MVRKDDRQIHLDPMEWRDALKEQPGAKPPKKKKPAAKKKKATAKKKP